MEKIEAKDYVTDLFNEFVDKLGLDQVIAATLTLATVNKELEERLETKIERGVFMGIIDSK